MAQVSGHDSGGCCLLIVIARQPESSDFANGRLRRALGRNAATALTVSDATEKEPPWRCSHWKYNDNHASIRPTDGVPITFDAMREDFTHAQKLYSARR